MKPTTPRSRGVIGFLCSSPFVFWTWWSGSISVFWHGTVKTYELPLLLSIGIAFLITLGLSWTASGAAGVATWGARASACTGRWDFQRSAPTLGQSTGRTRTVRPRFSSNQPELFQMFIENIDHLNFWSSVHGGISILLLGFLISFFLAQMKAFFRAIANWL